MSLKHVAEGSAWRYYGPVAQRVVTVLRVETCFVLVEFQHDGHREWWRRGWFDDVTMRRESTPP